MNSVMQHRLNSASHVHPCRLLGNVLQVRVNRLDDEIRGVACGATASRRALLFSICSGIVHCRSTDTAIAEDMLAKQTGSVPSEGKLLMGISDRADSLSMDVATLDRPAEDPALRASQSSTPVDTNGVEPPGDQVPLSQETASVNSGLGQPDSSVVGSEEQAELKAAEEQDERKKKVKKKKGRLRELEQIRADLAAKEVELLEKESELLGLEQTVSVLREELELERKIRILLTKDKEKAEEQAALAMGLCGGAGLLP